MAEIAKSKYATFVALRPVAWQSLLKSVYKSDEMGSNSLNTINRYTSLASAIHMLTKKQITLLDPDTWDDRNDVHFIQKYRSRNQNKQVFALCFSRSDQTYHHWRVFAPGPDGVCIAFYEAKLREVFSLNSNVEIGNVKYRSIGDARAMKPLSDENLKFLKHKRYEPEEETRIVYTGKTNGQYPTYPFPISAIERITLSPWLTKPLVDPMKSLIAKIDKCQRLKIYRSTLIDYRDWQSLADG
ncbi:DUF2971 domain-containing protein [Tropicimonas marinistellae]|uniref:DUF2971 domain-containing protein n=1 Tax=Tropicimonas marinistellae TaxID=1739787 RepID=UPI00122E4450|nr:DUF2971 domain-containing protein [Tropicimonas marinistellae]